MFDNTFWKLWLYFRNTKKVYWQKTVGGGLNTTVEHTVPCYPLLLEEHWMHLYEHVWYVSVSSRLNWRGWQKSTARVKENCNSLSLHWTNMTAHTSSPLTNKWVNLWLSTSSWMTNLSQYRDVIRAVFIARIQKKPATPHMHKNPVHTKLSCMEQAA